LDERGIIKTSSGVLVGEQIIRAKRGRCPNTESPPPRPRLRLLSTARHFAPVGPTNECRPPDADSQSPQSHRASLRAQFEPRVFALRLCQARGMRWCAQHLPRSRSPKNPSDEDQGKQASRGWATSPGLARDLIRCHASPPTPQQQGTGLRLLGLAWAGAYGYGLHQVMPDIDETGVPTGLHSSHHGVAGGLRREL